MADGWTKIAVVLVALIFLQSAGVNLLGSLGLGGTAAPAGTTTTATGGVTTVVTSDTKTTVTLSGINKYVTGTKLTSEYAKVFKNGFDQGQVSLNSGTFDSSPDVPLKVYYFENSSTYYTQKVEKVVPPRGTLDLQGEGMAWDTGLTLTSYNSDDQPNTAQAIGASTTKIMGFKYASTSQKGFGNPQCSEHSSPVVVVCFEYNTTFTGVEMKDSNGAIQASAATPASLAGLNASNTMKCYAGNGVYNGGEQRYKAAITSNTDPNAISIGVYFEDCDMDLNADNGAEIWSTHDEDNTNLGYTSYQKMSLPLS